MTSNLPKSLTEEFQTKWQSFRQAAEAAEIRLPKKPDHFESITQVFAFSDFVATSCTRNPAMLAELIDSGDLHRRYPSDEYKHILQTLLVDINDEDTLMRKLRQCRCREMVRIAWRDLAGWVELSETVADLSAFADSCLDQTLRILYRWHCSEYGVPTAVDNSSQQLVIIGLGKLGARELNFSSDVDLIFVYPQAGQTRNSDHTLSNDDFFTRLCRRFIKVIGQLTSDGMVFRVDLRLRPFGESGPLAMSFDALEQYYQEQGREWERYALIKARIVGGDKQAGKNLLERLHPFVYRRYLDYSAFESLREMKDMIALEVRRKGMENNIKLGPGGIREIEFFGQIFQLIRGGVTPALQVRGIQEVLNVLAAENYIPPHVCSEMTKAYIFLRDTENRLQEFSDQQSHELPSSINDQLRLAASLGFSNPRDFELHLANLRNQVHVHFQMLLATSDSETEEKQTDRQLDRIWQNQIANEQAQEILSSRGYDPPCDVLRLLDYLRNDPETKALSTRGRQRLDKLMPLILKEVGSSDQPLATIRRIIDLIKTIERRTSYLALLLENPTALTHLVNLSNSSPWITSFLARHPVLLDELLDPRTLYRPPQFHEIERELGQRLATIPSQDLEYQIEQMCIFKQVNVLRVAAADVAGTLPLMRVSDYLSEIAEIIMTTVTDISWNHLIEKHGHPICYSGNSACERGFAVIAYGKLGGLELGYGSDLDLVFLHAGAQGRSRGGERPIENIQFFNRLGQRVIHILTSHTRAGKLYEIDMRLRPSGSSGVLVSHINGFQHYQMKDAWTWEHQALIKARPICGENMLGEQFESIRREVLGLPRKKNKLQADVISMRQRMRKELLTPQKGVFDLKQDSGGMVDIEFLVQYLVLLNAHAYPELLAWTDIVRLLQSLAETDLIDEYTAHLLKHAYLIYRAAAHQLSLQEKPAKVPQEKFQHLQRRVQEIWHTIFESKF